MIAIWSFWSKPYLLARKQIWASERHHLLSWILSVQLAKKHFRKTRLVTDEYGARLLVDGLRLEFDDVQIVLNTLDEHDSKWWALGKLYTYRLQDAPFIHIDSDVFLWKPLPIAAHPPVFAQSPEYFYLGESFYKPDALADLMRQYGGWLPKEWQWYQSRGRVQRAECCGVFGGHAIKFINYYADLAIRTIKHTNNHPVWQKLDDSIERNILLEQYLLSACIDYHNHSNLNHSAIVIDYLFASESDAFNAEKSAAAGYTHLIADTKKDAIVANNLEQRVKHDYPEAYQRCLARRRISS
jgi:hypothetical protein